MNIYRRRTRKDILWRRVKVQKWFGDQIWRIARDERISARIVRLREELIMVRRIDEVHDPLLAGFFTIRDAARLLSIGNIRLVRSWLDGWKGRKAGPVIDRDFESRTVSFLDLMEIRFVNHFRKQEVSMSTIRLAARRLRDEWNTKHPLAFANSDKYFTDRRRIFALAADQEGDVKTWDLATNQYEIWAALESSIAENVAFDPVTEIARQWHPGGSEFPNVLVDPRFAFGQPVVGERPTPTSTIFKHWQAEGGNVDRVANWYRIASKDVNQAVEFELSLAA